MIGRSGDFMRSEIEQTDAEIRRAGYRGRIHFRPPNGKRLFALPWVLREMGRPLVLWDVAPDSADPGIPATQIVARVRDDVRPGSIVLLHLMTSHGQSSRAALPDVIRELRQRGFRFVTITELVDHAAAPT
jgi:peptidoglycan/xylan/chitin deacetylase (PgdA/CDA1 family)